MKRILGVVSCENIPLEQQANVQASSNISYIKDKQYGLCYATLGSSSWGGKIIVSITNVPCNKVGL